MKGIRLRHDAGAILRVREEYLPHILFIAAFIIRFHTLPDMSLSNDELSAWARLSFDSLGDVLRHGVAIDGHPAGTQVLLFYWSKVVGGYDLLLRLPFVLMGSASVVLFYQVARKLFGFQAACWVAAMSLLSEFLILYSRLARPYAMGVFGMALMLWGLASLARDDRRRIGHTAAYALGALIAAYTHHVAALSALVAGAFAFLLLGREKGRYWLSGSALAVVLYLPHLGITLGQLRLGGVGEWLAAPSASFLLDHIYLLFNHSWVIPAILLIMAVCRIFREQGEGQERRARTYLLILFLLPMAVTYAYSVWVNPVLQDSVLIFSAPALYILAASFIPSGAGPYRVLSRLALYLALVLSLPTFSVYDNKEFADFRGAAACMGEWQGKAGDDSIMHLVNVNHPVYLEAYLACGTCEMAIDYITEPGDLFYLGFLLKNDPRPWYTLINLRPIRPEAELMADYYGMVVDSGAITKRSEALLFRRRPHPDLQMDPDTGFRWLRRGEEEFSAEVLKAIELEKGMGIRADLAMDLGPGPLEGLVLVCTLVDDRGELLHWNGIGLNNFDFAGRDRAWLSTFYTPERTQHAQLKAYIWDPEPIPGDSLRYRLAGFDVRRQGP